MATPRPITVLAIGDSITNNPGQSTALGWGLFWNAHTPGTTFVNEATSGKCLFDTTGPLGADTVQASIGTDLSSNPNTDIVVWATSAINDVLRVKQILASTTLANLQSAATLVLDTIVFAKASAIVMGIPMVQALINGFGGGDATSSQTAYTLRTSFNSWLQIECAKRSFVYFDAKYLYNDLGPLTIPLNGLVAEYNDDGLHPNNNADNVLCETIGGIMTMMNKRKRAAA